jgi:hypothetical protein
MSTGSERTPDEDAWAEACAEDLRAERERRRTGPDPAEDLRRLADTVTEQVARLGASLGAGPGVAALAAQARRAVDPLIDRNADALSHLAAAGEELLAAYRSATRGAGGRGTRAARDGGDDGHDDGDGDDGGRGGDGDDAGGARRVDLD